MLDAVAVLQMEHRRIGRVLGFLQRQATNLSQRTPANYRLLAVAFEYLSGYPDQCHHPKEDALYGKLVRRLPGSADKLGNLVREHERLADMTRELSRAIGDAAQDPSAPDLVLADRLKAYLYFYHQHMRMEELHFFPLARSRLSRDEFAEIDFTLFDRPDPLFNRAVETKFALLSDEIERLGLTEDAVAAQREEAALLASIIDIATFNGAMQAIGEPVALTGSPVDGYVLERMGHALVRIPACSEPRAAWSAYFFWKAASEARSLR